MLGALVLVVGIALAAVGALVATTVGSDDALSTAPARIRGTGVAVVAEDVRVDEGGLPVPSGVGTLTLSVRARDGRAMFAGVAAPADIDHYLTGAPYDVVVDLSAGSSATTRAVPGTQQPPPPGSVRIWTDSASGAPAALAARFTPGTTLVVMNADARPGVDADVVVTLRVPHAWVYAWVAAGIGVLLLVLGVILIRRSRAARRRVPAPSVPVVPLGTSVLPGPAPDTAPPAEDLVAPASGALAALVVEAAADPTGALERPGAGVPASAIPAAGEPVAAPEDQVAAPEDQSDAVPDAEPDPGADPVFAELVSAYGVDPVHDALPTVPGAGRAGGDTDPAVPGPSGAPPSGG